MHDSPDQPRWSIEIHHVSSCDRQQRILEAFRDIGRPNVTALGSQSGHEWFVIVETASIQDRFFARSTISTIDPHATRAYSFRPPHIVGPVSAS